jgi:hypothetical protein
MMKEPPSTRAWLFALASILIFATACQIQHHPSDGPVAGSNSNAGPSNKNEASVNRNGPSDGAPVEASEEDFEGTAGIVEERKPGQYPGVLKEVRTAAHPNFDRVVFEFEGKAVPGYKLEYVDKPVRHCGSGDAVAVDGDGRLSVTFTPAQAHTDAGEATVKDRERRPNLRTLKEVESTCDFEGEVAWVLGVTSPNRYRVIELASPARLVVDVKH